MKRLLIVATALLLIVASPYALKQTEPNVRNPSAVEFTPSGDHAALDGYDLDLLRADGTVLQTLNLGKPTVNNGICRVTINVQPVAFGVNYSMRLRARAGGAFSDYTASVNKFDRVPGAPTNVIIK